MCVFSGGWNLREKKNPLSSCQVLGFLPNRQQYLHNGATLGLVLAECGGEQLCLAGKVQESLGEAAHGAGLVRGLHFADAGLSRRTEDAVDALLRREGGALQVGLGSELLGHG